jgi:hypothetical protein
LHVLQGVRVEEQYLSWRTHLSQELSCLRCSIQLQDIGPIDTVVIILVVGPIHVQRP